MKHNYIKFTIFILLISLLFSCQKNRKFDQLVDEFIISVVNRDREKLLQIASEIKDKDIEGQEGKDFLKLKLQALTFSGEYEEAYYEASKGIKLFHDDYEFLIAEGALGRMNNIETDSFIRALNLLEQLPKKEDDGVILLKIYLQLILNRNNINYSEINSDLEEIIMYYILLENDELYLVPPLDFLRLTPFNMEINNSNEDKYWL